MALAIRRAGAAIGCGLLFCGFSFGGDEGMDEPSPDLRQAEVWKRENQPVLDKLLSGATPAMRAAAVRVFLRSSSPDDGSHAGAVLDVDASVCSASARLMLLDRIGARPGLLDTADALEISRAALKSDSPEMRIVALRNLARLSPADRAETGGQLVEIVRAGGGGQNGSFAYGQAFDGIVFLRQMDAIPALALRLKEEKNAPLAGATLDRLAEADPPRMAAYLDGHPDVLREYPMLRADYYAKGDVSSDAFRKLVERYLQRPEVSPGEAEKFFFSYLQGGAFLVDGIFTGVARMPAGNRDRAGELRGAVALWEKNPAMRKATEAWRSVWKQIDAPPSEDATPR